MNDIAIYLTNEDAERYKQFLRHYDVINELLIAHVFDTKNGSATLDFGPEGHLMDIKLNIVTYKRKQT